jgi:PAS domain S-box-containing protein
MMNRCLMCRLIIGLLLVLIGASPADCRTRQVVLLYDERTTLPGLAALDASIARTLTSSSAEPIEVYRESMDLSRFSSDTYLLLLQSYLRKKYADKKIDVVVAVMSPALDFLLSHENVVFPGTPIVFCGIDRRELGGRALPSRVTGVLLKRAFAPTLDIALKLHPRTRRVVFVAGTSEFDSRLLEQAREELLLYKDRLDFTYLTALPMHDLLSQVSELPPHTIVLYSTLFKDGAGAPFVPHDVAEHLAAASNAPVYGFLDQYLGRGIVGGRMYTMNAHGEAAAGLVLTVLAGIPPSNIPVVEPEASVTQFDWRQLQRWGIRESQLPQGSTVLFRQMSFWDKYKLYVLGVAAILTVQAVIIGGLLLQRKRRRRAEEALRASEERLRLAQQAARIGSFEWNIRTGVNTWTPELEAMYGLQPGGFSQTQTAFENLVHADDRAGVIKLVDRALKTGQPTEGEWRVVWADGSVHWITGRWQVLMNKFGEAARIIGVNIDVTERKLAEKEVLEVNRRLIEAQEQERARIGRELHDDVNQRLAMLAIELEQLQDNPSEVRSRVQELRKQTTEISNDVQALSHELHSSKLEYLGAIGGMKSWCKEFGEHQGIQIEFKSTEVQTSVAPEVGLCLFRVLQEALHNAVKHSGVKRIEVQLREHSGEIHLVISDLGGGFDLETATQGRGLGLTSMQERVRLVNGIVEIQSKPMGGTTVHVRVPLTSEPASQRAAG